VPLRLKVESAGGFVANTQLDKFDPVGLPHGTSCLTDIHFDGKRLSRLDRLRSFYDGRMRFFQRSLVRGIFDPVDGHKKAFYFLMAVGFWNFVGAGIFGFLINMPVVSYLEAGTILTLNHGHAALLGAFGMLAMALVVLGLRHVLTDEQWAVPEKFIKVSFWGLNVGLALMVITNLFPVGVLQIWNVLENGYWHARSLELIGQDRIRLLEWASMPSHVILIALGVAPLVIANGLIFLKIKKA
jgi:nitric oxide reductase large subunit